MSARPVNPSASVDSSSEHRELNRAYWNSRASAHAASDDYAVEELAADPNRLSDVLRFDAPRLGDLSGLDVLHLQCHIGTDTLSLARMGGKVKGLDLSEVSLDEARSLAERAGVAIDYRHGSVDRAVEVFGVGNFDLVYTGIGALCWLPSIRDWAESVAQLLRPGGRLHVRDSHPVLQSSCAMVVRDEHPDNEQQGSMSGPGDTTVALELPYFEQLEPTTWRDEVTYVATDAELPALASVEWNHGIAETVMAVLDAGLELTNLVEHDSVPWDALPGMMVADERGEYLLKDRPSRMPMTFTLMARRPG